MAEQTFRSPGFFEREIDATARETSIVGTPAGVVGTAEKGPAFVPVTVGSMTDFINKFGGIDTNRFGPYAVQAFLANRTALTYMRVLGAGANETTTDISNTENLGTVVNAGFKLTPATTQWRIDTARGSAQAGAYSDSCVQFLAAKHYVSGATDYSHPMFIDNPSFSSSGADTVNLVRGVIFTASGSRMQILDIGQNWSNTLDARAGFTNGGNLFALAVSSSRGGAYTAQFAGTDKHGKEIAGQGVRILTASLDPSNSNYIANVLNTDPLKFYEHQHLLYLDFAVESEIAGVDESGGASAAYPLALLSGSDDNLNNALTGAERKALSAFGRFDTRYTTAQSPQVFSQPYGGAEYPLFGFESLSDGEYANDNVKITIANLRASTDGNYPYPEFEVQVRKFSDSDLDPQVLETYPGCNLDPGSENFIARKIGDYKARYNFDAESDVEKRIIVTGRYANVSNYIRVVMHESVYNRLVPRDACPFGFSGMPAIKTSDSLTDTRTGLKFGGVQYGENTVDGNRMWGGGGAAAASAGPLTGSIIPPLPFRFKITRGNVKNNYAGMAGDPSSREIVDRRLNWGVKWSRCPETGSMSSANLNVNASSIGNPLIRAYAKMNGISKLDTVVTGSGMDAFNANKFTLARVALVGTGSGGGNLLTYVTGTAQEVMKEACYIRNGVPDSQTYAVMDPDKTNQGRVTLATLIQSSSVKFNRFTAYTAFNIPLYGGFDGVNILNKEMFYMNDRAASTDATSGGQTGLASDEFNQGTIGLSPKNSGGSLTNQSGQGRLNNIIQAYRKAAEIMTDPMSTRINLLAIPGIRDPYVTDHAALKTKEYSMAMYVMDIPSWTESETRLFGGEDSSKIASASYSLPDVRETAEQFESRVFDNNYTSVYFPDVYITDSNTNSKVRVPASIAAMSALGYNDKVAYPWFAPAGFNRGGLGIVSNTAVRLTAGDRDDLYDARVNPIANFSDGSFVIFGQKTCQLAKSALDRVNVRRMLLEVKRQVVAIADKILFEPNNDATRARFVNQVTPLLATIQSQQGIESFKVVMDGSNNTSEDVENNRLNGRIVVVPTRAIEFIAIDFIITNSGVDFA
jgi:hypothetical protein